jgi:two-component system, chemotaxis family, sensor kinase CheA
MAADPFKYFRVEARELLEQLGKGALELEKGAGAAEHVPRLLRLAHTLKGASRVVKELAMAEQAHALEDVLQPFRESSAVLPREACERMLALLEQMALRLPALGAPPSTEALAPLDKPPAAEESRTVRAELTEVDQLLEGIGEVHAQLNALGKLLPGLDRARHLTDALLDNARGRGGGRSGGPGLARAEPLVDELGKLLAKLEHQLTRSLEQMRRELGQVRGFGEQLRLVPAANILVSLERTARDTAHSLGKQVRFEARGGDVRLDAHVLDAVLPALVQLIRNGVAHGIESSAERRTLGKPAQGRIALDVRREGRRVVFRCEDDGRGIDLEGVRRSAVRRGVAQADIERLDSNAILSLLLRGGISTAAKVTEVSGRGVGLDVVREAAERLAGEVHARSQPGRGTEFELSVPLSVAALEGLVVEVGGMPATIPLDAVRRTLRLEPSALSRAPEGETIVSEGKVIPFVRLHKALRRAEGDAFDAERTWSTVVVEAAAGMAALGVDRLLGTATVVLRPLPEHAPADALVAGASIDIDGNPQLVLDPDGLVRDAQRHAAERPNIRAMRHSILVIDDSLTTRMLEQSILESAGYLVDTASSAEEALSILSEKRYALCLVDVEMPGMDGFAFVERIRAEPALREMPAILVTSLAGSEHKKRGQAVGAQGYVVKSEFDQADLLARIRQLLG